MPVSAILAVSTRSLFSPAGPELRNHCDGPIASVPVLGQSVLERTMSRLRATGISTISVVSESVLGQRFIWDALSRQASRGFSSVLLIRLGAYAEVDYAELLKLKYQARANVVRVCDSDGPLDFWALDPVRLVRSGISFDSSLRLDDNFHLLYLTKGYVNRMTNAAAVRRLAADMLHGQCTTQPCGEQVRAGVWVDRGARVHGRAQIKAPAYVGCGARVRSSASVAGLSTVERGSLVDRGAAVEESSILPHTYVGKGINVAQAVVAESRLIHLRSDVTVTIDDPRIIGRAESRWNSFWYDRRDEFIPQPSRPARLEPVAYEPGQQQQALRLLSKGEA